MARLKRNSPAVEKAEIRAAALAGIAPNLDLGNNLTLVAYSAAIAAAKKKLADYNTRLSELDGMLNEIQALEDILNDWSERMLAGVAMKYGKDSNEYEKAGGTKKSERRSPVRKPAADSTASV